jgi:hypothetical protein
MTVLNILYLHLFNSTTMKKIHFNDISKDKFFIILMIISISCIIIGTLRLMPFENIIINKYISGFGFLSQAIIHSRMFWYKNYMQWNKNGIVIRIKSFFGVNLSFEDIKSVSFENKILSLTTHYKTHQIDLNDINDTDCKKLVSILEDNKYKD